MIEACYLNHCVYKCAERCKFTPQADIDLKAWWDARTQERAEAVKQMAAERSEDIHEWANTPLVDRLRKLLADNGWDLGERDIVTLTEAIDALSGDA